MKNDLTIRRADWLVICWLAVLAVGADARAVPISLGGGMTLPTSMVYQGPDMTPTPMWNVMPTTTFLGSVLNDSGSGNKYRLVITSFSWSGHELIADLSDDLGVPASGPSLAEATFAGGGTLTISGTVRDWASPATVYATGSLLVADVISGFHLQENDINGTVISNIGQTIQFEPTGGWLYDGATNNILQLRGLYELVFNSQQFGPMAGGPLDNFQQSIATIGTGLNIQFHQVPEPGSVLLLSFGMCMVFGRRGRAR